MSKAEKPNYCCPVHNRITLNTPGYCRVCGRALATEPWQWRSNSKTYIKQKRKVARLVSANDPSQLTPEIKIDTVTNRRGDIVRVYRYPVKIGDMVILNLIDCKKTQDYLSSRNLSLTEVYTIKGSTAREDNLFVVDSNDNQYVIPSAYVKPINKTFKGLKPVDAILANDMLSI